jgi:3-isopropylmalate dehydrogenase
VAANKKLLILPGDYVGPEVMDQVKRVIRWMDLRRAVRFEVSERPIGGASYDAYGTPLSDETLDLAKASDAVLLGAVGGPKYSGPGGRAPAPAQGDGPVRQPAPCGDIRCLA